MNMGRCRRKWVLFLFLFVSIQALLFIFTVEWAFWGQNNFAPASPSREIIGANASVNGVHNIAKKEPNANEGLLSVEVTSSAHSEASCIVDSREICHSMDVVYTWVNGTDQNHVDLLSVILHIFTGNL
ncbi:hypothetical protein Pelo_13209 [Pelomyxa schiedti]|nr:hypothetical protein Pelo_13209 [Pelomyxa schiedti]